MIDWLASHGVELASLLVSLAVTITGWIMEHRSSKRRDVEREKDVGLLTEQVAASNEMVERLKRQVSALESQADALQRQAALMEREASTPDWDIRQVQNLRHAVTNKNGFDALDVRVELSDGNEYKLGDISRGSEASFLFLERGLEASTNDDVRITWALPDDPSHRFSVTKPVPPYRQS